MTALNIERHPLGPRVRVAGQRIHHGAIGVLVAVAAVHRHDVMTGLLAVALVTHDRKDASSWFRKGWQG